MKIILFFLSLLVTAPVLATEWQVERVRGEVSQQISGAWHAVARGDVIPSERYIRTGATGRVGLVRGREAIELEGDTQIRIRDAGADLMTTVLQDFGVVTIDVERRNVEHFSVQTRFLAAVVKGTRFTVRSDDLSSAVKVDRGTVQVQDKINDLVSDVRPGQAAVVGAESPLLVEGRGAIGVFSFEGVPVVNGSTITVEAQKRMDRIRGDRADDASRPGNGNGKALGWSSGAGSKNDSDNGNGRGNSGTHSSSGGQGHDNAPDHSQAVGNGNDTEQGHAGGHGIGQSADNASNSGSNAPGRRSDDDEDENEDNEDD